MRSAPAGPEAAEPNLPRARRLVLELLKIPGLSGQEAAVAGYVRRALVEAGLPASALAHDAAHRSSRLGGEVGNLIARLPGTIRGPRRLLMAHLDTVPLCAGAKPAVRGDEIASSDPRTALGADDRAGVAVVLTAALEILRCGLPHPPLTFFWPVQEEVGLLGARHVKRSLLGRPKLCFNWDGGPAEKVTLGATGAYRMQIEIEGLASHAGGAPEAGVSAIAIAGLAIADLQRDGWHGAVEKPQGRGTSNIGYISGGGATNVVTDRVQLKAEARSHDPAFRLAIVERIEQAFHRAAREVRSVKGQAGRVTIARTMDYESFQLADDEPCVAAAERALRAIGLEPMRAVSNGGLDANWMTAHGFPTVTLGCGQRDVHTTRERLDLPVFDRACRVALRLATGC